MLSFIQNNIIPLYHLPHSTCLLAYIGKSNFFVYHLKNFDAFFMYTTVIPIHHLPHLTLFWLKEERGICLFFTIEF
jgi:hypothetical protein